MMAYVDRTNLLRHHTIVVLNKCRYNNSICICPSVVSNHLGVCHENNMYAKSDNQKRRSFFLSGGDMLVTNVYLMPSRFSPLQGWHPNIVATWRIDPRWICRHLRTCAPVPSTRHRKGWIDSAPFLCKRSSLIALRCGRRL